MNAKQSIKGLMQELNNDGLSATEIYNMCDNFSSLFVLYRDIKIKNLINSLTKHGEVHTMIKEIPVKNLKRNLIMSLITRIVNGII